MRRSENQSECQKRTELFMEASGQTINSRPTTPGKADRLLRAKLIFEEALETIDSLGVRVLDFTDSAIELADFMLEPLPDGEFDLVDSIDGCVDLIVVATGTLSTIGVDDKPHQLEVDNANLRKIGPDGFCEIREDGKLLKPDDWTGPDHISRLPVARGILHHPATHLPEADPAMHALLGRKRGGRHAGLRVHLQHDQPLKAARLVPPEIGAAHAPAAKRPVGAQGQVHAGVENLLRDIGRHLVARPASGVFGVVVIPAIGQDIGHGQRPVAHHRGREQPASAVNSIILPLTNSAVAVQVPI